jgi:hypothetical protein
MRVSKWAGQRISDRLPVLHTGSAGLEKATALPSPTAVAVKVALGISVRLELALAIDVFSFGREEPIRMFSRRI